MIMIDCKRRSIGHQAQGRAVHFGLMILILVIAMVAIVSKLARVDKELLLSPDAISYMHRQGSGMVFSDMDVE